MRSVKSFPYPPVKIDEVPDYLRKLYISLTELASIVSGLSKATSSPSWPTSSWTSSGTPSSTDGTILVDATSGNITVTLPTAASALGTAYYIKKIDTSANKVIIDGDSSETIDDSTTIELIVPYECALIQSDGTEWWVL